MTEPLNPLVEAAKDYLERGLRVIALTGKMPNGKVHRKGIYDCLTGASLLGLSEVDVQRQLRAVFCHPDTTGIGILTGFPLYVVDIDGEEGAVAFSDITGGQWSSSPSGGTWVAQTGRGLHLYYASEHTFTTRKLAEKLDFKAAGGYVAAPPSAHPDGNSYKWLILPSESTLAELPVDLVRLLLEQDELRSQRIITKEADRRPIHKMLEDGVLWATPLSLEGPIRRLQEAVPGERNAVLFWAACTILKDGASEEELNDLYDAALACGLDAQESKRTIQSAMKKVRA
jgi:hypothetical protein